MTSAQRAHFESLLLFERKKTLRELCFIAAELQDAGNAGDSRPAVADSGDRARAAAAVTLETAMEEHESTGLSNIDEALERLYKNPDTYGLCCVCRKPISELRLEVVPETRYCSKHASNPLRKPA